MVAEPPGQPTGGLTGLAPGTLVAGYRVESRIGAGGMAMVLRASDEALGRLVALKILAPALAGDREFRERFVRESRAVAAVDHPNIIPVYAAGDAGGVLYLAMRYVTGGDLHSVVNREGPLPGGRAVSLLSPIASALDAAHAAGLVHRDVKPANILIDDSPGRPEHPYLSDFGLAKGASASAGLTGTGQFLGTPHYAAPEQIAGRRTGPHTDQYALACVAYTVLTGTLPFPRDDAMAVLWAHTYERPPSLTASRPDLPASADRVIARALAKAPEDRYPTCGQFIGALGAALTGRASARARQAPADSGDAGRSNGSRAPWDTEPARRPAAPGAAPSILAAPYPQAEQPTVAATQDRLRRPVDHPPAGFADTRRSRHSAGRRRTRGVAIGAAVVVAAGCGTVAALLATSAPGPGQHAATTRVSLAAVLPAPEVSGIVTAAFTPSGTLMTGDMFGSLYAWNVATRHATALVKGQGSSLGFATLSANGALFAASEASGQLGIWDTSTGDKAATDSVTGPDSGYSCLLSSTGLLADFDPATPERADVFNLRTGKRLAVLSPPDGVGITSVAISADGGTVATSNDKGITYLWKVSSAAAPALRLASPDGTRVYNSALSADGRRLITSDGKGAVYVWSVATGQLVSTLSVPKGGLDIVALSPDGKLAAGDGFESNAISIWNVATGKLVATVTDPEGHGATALAFNAPGTELAVTDTNANVNVWKIAAN